MTSEGAWPDDDAAIHKDDLIGDPASKPNLVVTTAIVMPDAPDPA